MCGRYTHLFTWRQLCRLMSLLENAGPPPGFRSRSNVAPTQDAPIVRLSNENARRREATMARWGLAPHWARDPMRGPINLRAETLATNRTSRDAFRHRRCLVPASGFYEWQQRGSREPKQPWYIHPAGAEPIFAFAGLWESWADDETGRLTTFAIITTDANDAVKPIHERMPSIIHPSSFEQWLDPRAAPGELGELLRPIAPEAIAMHPVGTRVNTPATDDPSLIEPVAPTRGLFD